MDVWVVVEGREDELFLDRALSELFPQQGFVFMVAQDKARVVPVAETAVLLKKQPVLVVVHSDQDEPEARELERLDLLSEIRAARRPKEVEVVLAPTALDPAAFFEVGVLERVVGRELTPSEVALARAAPKQFWKTLLATDQLDEPLSKLTSEDYRSLSRVAPFDRLSAFLRGLSTVSARAGSN